MKSFCLLLFFFFEQLFSRLQLMYRLCLTVLCLSFFFSLVVTSKYLNKERTEFSLICARDNKKKEAKSQFFGLLFSLVIADEDQKENKRERESNNNCKTLLFTSFLVNFW